MGAALEISTLDEKQRLGSTFPWHDASFIGSPPTAQWVPPWNLHAGGETAFIPSCSLHDIPFLGSAITTPWEQLWRSLRWTWDSRLFPWRSSTTNRSTKPSVCSFNIIWHILTSYKHRTVPFLYTTLFFFSCSHFFAWYFFTISQLTVNKRFLRSVLGIRDIFVRVRIPGSVPLTYGSGSGSNSGSDFFLHWIKGCKKLMFFSYFFLITCPQAHHLQPKK